MSIKLNTFMTLYNTKKTDEEKLKILLEHIKNEYVPYEKKYEVAKAIVDTCYWKKVTDSGEKDSKVFYIDSVAKYMITCISIFDLYTDIERQKNDSKMLDDFNILNKNRIFDLLIQNIDEIELKEFNMILQMVCDDVLMNEYEIHSFINKQISRFSKLVDVFSRYILNNVDIENIINKIGIEK